MTILRSGTTKNYSENWGKAFGEKTRKPKSTPTAKKKSKEHRILQKLRDPDFDFKLGKKPEPES